MLYDPKWRVSTASGRALLAAADYIERHGWCQHKQRLPDGSVCVYGALLAVARGSVLRAALRKMRHRCGMTVGYWNDTSGRTQEEVVATLREAALPR